MKRTTTKILECVIVVLCIVLLVLVAYNPPFGRTSNSDMQQDVNAVRWNGIQTLPQQAGQQSGTAIPGFDKLAFYADELTQKVNFYNPQENHCYFKMSLFVEDDLLWQSGYVAPGCGFYEIILNHGIQQGSYNGFLKIECFSYDGEVLNSAKVHFELMVIAKE